MMTDTGYTTATPPIFPLENSSQSHKYLTYMKDLTGLDGPILSLVAVDPGYYRRCQKELTKITENASPECMNIVRAMVFSESTDPDAWYAANVLIQSTSRKWDRKCDVCGNIKGSMTCCETVETALRMMDTNIRMSPRTVRPYQPRYGSSRGKLRGKY